MVKLHCINLKKKESCFVYVQDAFEHIYVEHFYKY